MEIPCNTFKIMKIIRSYFLLLYPKDVTLWQLSLNIKSGSWICMHIWIAFISCKKKKNSLFQGRQRAVPFSTAGRLNLLWNLVMLTSPWGMEVGTWTHHTSSAQGWLCVFIQLLCRMYRALKGGNFVWILVQTSLVDAFEGTEDGKGRYGAKSS